MEDIQFVGFLSKLLEAKLLHVLRFKNGQAQDEGRFVVRESLTPLTAQLSLQRILPFPCKKQHTVVILMAQASVIEMLRSALTPLQNGYLRDTKVSH